MKTQQSPACQQGFAISAQACLPVLEGEPAVCRRAVGQGRVAKSLRSVPAQKATYAQRQQKAGGCDTEDEQPEVFCEPDAHDHVLRDGPDVVNAGVCGEGVKMSAAKEADGV